MKRDEVQQIINQLKEERITLLVGSRRTGKSTLLFNTIEYLLSSGVKPINILYFSADNTKLIHSAKDLSDVIDFYARDVLYSPFSSLKEKIYILIDEIHLLRD
jgi:predicted AAA+ superfamily ATPase